MVESIFCGDVNSAESDAIFEGGLDSLRKTERYDAPHINRLFGEDSLTGSLFMHINISLF
jgi:hypothetical protein